MPAINACTTAYKAGAGTGTNISNANGNRWGWGAMSMTLFNTVATAQFAAVELVPRRLRRLRAG